MKVLQINSQDTYSVRSIVLTDEFTDNFSYKEDDHEQTFHLGAFIDNKLVSVASFFYQSHKLFKDEHLYKLQGMATIKQFRHQGFSSELLKIAFPIIKNNSCTRLWCEARETAREFYEKVGFQVDDGPFEDKRIGYVYLMSKEIS